jgi:hypothetical protein
MTMTKINTGGKDFAPTPQLKLTEKKGNFIKGVLKKKIQDSTYPDKLNFFITVKDLEGETVIWDKEARVERPLDATVGGDVFVKGFTQLSKALAQVAEGTYIEVVYTGKGTAQKGRRAPYLVDVSVEA